MFQSARFKLTMFYLGIILALSLTLSFGTRWLAQHEFEQGNMAQRGAFRGVVTKTLGIRNFKPTERTFSFQRLQEQHLRNKLNNYVLIVNLGALVIGGVASYLFAGRTLRPIEEAHDAQRRFAADASHELRTPLTAIKAENEVFLRQKDFAKADARSLIESNLEEVDRLERLAANLLALTDYEDVALAHESLPIEAVIADALQQSDKTHPNAKVDNQAAEATVIGDYESLVQLVGIVLDNAFKYGAKNKPVTITSSIQDDRYLLSIADQGKGIARDDLPHIFERLYRADKARSSTVGGYGLGLALAERIATANNAEISAANGASGGAVFTISLQVG